jgi:hypothetical protein
VARRDGQPALGPGGGAERVGGEPGLLLHPSPGEPVRRSQRRGGRERRWSTGVSGSFLRSTHMQLVMRPRDMAMGGELRLVRGRVLVRGEQPSGRA